MDTSPWPPPAAPNLARVIPEARYVRQLPPPASLPGGPIEVAVMRMIHRVAPFDRLMVRALESRFGLDGGDADLGAALDWLVSSDESGHSRRLGASRERLRQRVRDLRELALALGPPRQLLEIRQLLGEGGPLPTSAIHGFLRDAGVSQIGLKASSLTSLEWLWGLEPSFTVRRYSGREWCVSVRQRSHVEKSVKRVAYGARRLGVVGPGDLHQLAGGTAPTALARMAGLSFAPPCTWFLKGCQIERQVKRLLCIAGPLSLEDLLAGLRRSHHELRCRVPPVELLHLWLVSQPWVEAQPREGLWSLSVNCDAELRRVDRVWLPLLKSGQPVSRKRALREVERAGLRVSTGSTEWARAPYLVSVDRHAARLRKATSLSIGQNHNLRSAGSG